MKSLSVEVLVLLALGMAVSSAPPDPRIAELESRLETTQGKDRALILADLAGRYYRIDPEKTLAYAHEALALGKALKDPQSHAEALQILGMVYQAKGDMPRALEYLEESLKIATAAGDDRQAAFILKNLGAIHYYGSDWHKSLEYTSRAVTLIQAWEKKATAAGDKNAWKVMDKFRADSRVNMAACHKSLGEYEQALDLLFKALSTYESATYAPGIAGACVNAGEIYKLLKNPDKAREYFLRARDLLAGSPDKYQYAMVLSSLGGVHLAREEYEQALEYYQQARLLNEKLDHKANLISNYGRISEIRARKGEYDAALELEMKALQLSEQIGERSGTVFSTLHIGEIYLGMKKPDQALPYLEKAIRLAEEIRSLDGARSGYEKLAKYHEMQGDFPKALEAYRKGAAAFEKLFSEANSQKLAELQSRYDTVRKEQEIKLLKKDQEIKDLEIARQKAEAARRGQEIALLTKDREIRDLEIGRQKAEAARKEQEITLLTKDREIQELELGRQRADTARKGQEIALLSKDREIQGLEIGRQRAWLVFMVAGLGLLLLLAVLVVNRYRLKTKAHRQLTAAHAELQKAALTIQEQSRHILDSIEYAERIQLAILPLEERMRAVLPEHFVLFRPRDIVSGDFYWFETAGDAVLVAVVDCTGHGVPGALMSMIGSTLLNKLVGERAVLSPGRILTELHREIRGVLRQESGSGQAHDGMDMALCRIDPGRRRLVFAGAGRPLYLARDGNGGPPRLVEIRGDRHSIGGRQREANRTFSEHEVSLVPGDTIYLSSDGFPDQNDPADRKLGSWRFKRLLEQCAALQIEKQREFLLRELLRFQGREKQRDDILLVGIRPYPEGSA